MEVCRRVCFFLKQLPPSVPGREPEEERIAYAMARILGCRCWSSG